MSKFCFGAKVSPEFIDRMLVLEDSFGWTPQQTNYLMACMAFESAETFSPRIKNGAGSGATGLIQFMPSTARGLGTTTADLERMTAVEQLDWVEKYFRPYYRRTKTLSDMYMAILLPKYVGAPEDAVLFREGTVAYRQNSGLDRNKDGVVTKAEAASLVMAKFDKGMVAPYVGWVD